MSLCGQILDYNPNPDTYSELFDDMKHNAYLLKGVQ